MNATFNASFLAVEMLGETSEWKVYRGVRVIDWPSGLLDRFTLWLLGDSRCAVECWLDPSIWSQTTRQTACERLARHASGQSIFIRSHLRHLLDGGCFGELNITGVPSSITPPFFVCSHRDRKPAAYTVRSDLRAASLGDLPDVKWHLDFNRELETFSPLATGSPEDESSSQIDDLARTVHQVELGSDMWLPIELRWASGAAHGALRLLDRVSEKTFISRVYLDNELEPFVPGAVLHRKFSRRTYRDIAHIDIDEEVATVLEVLSTEQARQGGVGT